ncbi:MAG: TIM barrel protein [Candidatus Micrarchaeota archaeon]
MPLIFGTAGIPISCKGSSSAEGVLCVKQLGLGAMELEYVHGVKVNPTAAQEIGRIAKANGIILSCHAPYYISLISAEHSKRKKSHAFILDTARQLHYAGGGKVVFHAGFYGKLSPEKAFEEMKGEMEFLQGQVEKEKLNVVLAPETTGKGSQWGSLDELLRMKQEVKGLSLTIDFSHVHARANGMLKTRADFEKLFDLIEKADKTVLKDLHCHFQSVKYSEKGELYHMQLSANSPPFKPFVELCAERKVSGVVICESPVIEADALEMKRFYEKLLR